MKLATVRGRGILAAMLATATGLSAAAPAGAQYSPYGPRTQSTSPAVQSTPVAAWQQPAPRVAQAPPASRPAPPAGVYPSTTPYVASNPYAVLNGSANRYPTTMPPVRTAQAPEAPAATEPVQPWAPEATSPADSEQLGAQSLEAPPAPPEPGLPASARIAPPAPPQMELPAPTYEDADTTPIEGTDLEADRSDEAIAEESLLAPVDSGTDGAIAPLDGCTTDVCFDGPCGNQWFLGVYGLSMQRDSPGRQRLAVQVDDGSAYPYFPTDADTILTTLDADPDFQGGAEVRFGSTFGGRSLGGVNYQPFAWEIGYWGLADESDSATVSDNFANTTRIYGTVNFTGLSYDRDGGAGAFAAAPVNDFYGYEQPVTDPAGGGANTNVVLGQRIRTSFSADNLELNFWRLSAPPMMYADGSGGQGRLFFNGLAGVRYLQLDEDLQYATLFSGTTGGVADPGEPTTNVGFSGNDDNVLFYDVEVDNDLVGFQFGFGMNYVAGRRWSLFCDTNMGIYGNDVEQYQRVYSGGGGVVTGPGGSPARIRSSKQDVAFLGELRLGAGYQFKENWRLTAAWRVIAVSGVALAMEQIPTDFTSYDSIQYLDTNDSLVLHGLQLGVEARY